MEKLEEKRKRYHRRCFTLYYTMVGKRREIKSSRLLMSRVYFDTGRPVHFCPAPIAEDGTILSTI
jgi:hypothetical protein